MSYGNYGKKDEDADLGLVKVDRTQVFQEGEEPQSPPCSPHNQTANVDQHVSSTAHRSSRDDAESS